MISTIYPIVIIAPGNGTFWLTYAEGGDKLYLHHQAVLISKFSAPMGLLLAR